MFTAFQCIPVRVLRNSRATLFARMAVSSLFALHPTIIALNLAHYPSRSVTMVEEAVFLRLGGASWVATYGLAVPSNFTEYSYRIQFFACLTGNVIFSNTLPYAVYT